MASLGPRVFKRLDIAYNSLQYNPFFLEQMANVQWNNKAPFIRGPFMEGKNHANDEYAYWSTAGEIEYALRFYMKPYSIHTFGCDVHNFKEKPALLTRCWLHSTATATAPQTNNVLVFMERLPSLEPLFIQEYWRAINNNSWLPENWSAITKATEIEQTLVLTNKPYEGCYAVQMNLR